MYVGAKNNINSQNQLLKVLEMGLLFVIGLGFAIHVVLLLAVFDLYFTSPITHGINPVTNNVPTHCKRVVVVSIDGLRIDALREPNEKAGGSVAPFLQKQMSEWGAWGVSKCHMPTESRPGHVAMLAGFYEDPSAVTKGWKENPVNFDSLFNQSRCSFAWGSPDIVNIFYKGLKHDCSYKWTYSEEQDFAGNTMASDDWVLDQLINFFETSESSRKYSEPKSLFFLHLLGQDTSGHTHKPWTERYRENLRNVDSIIRKVNHLFSMKFSDNNTSFVISADHGMTDWGSHGAGDPSETLTPIVTWGCGIKKSLQGETEKEINQADITPLVAILLGISIPVNSVGILPASFLNLSRLEIAEANLLNAEQIAQQFLAKRSEIELKTSLTLYKKYNALDSSLIAKMKESILSDIKQGKPTDANEKSRTLLELSLDGIKYYQNYFQTWLLVATTAIIIGWILVLLLGVSEYEILYLHPPISFYLISAILGGSVSFIVYCQGLPITYHAYALTPILLWGILTQHYTSWWAILSKTVTSKNFTAVVLLLVGIELMVFGFFQRWSLSIILTCIVFWPIIWLNIRKYWKLVSLWALSGLSLAIFSLMPVIGKEPNPILPMSASIFITASLFAKSWNRLTLKTSCHCLLVIATGVNSFYVHTTFIATTRLSSTNSIISWLLLGISMASLFLPSACMLEKLHNSFASLSVPFLLLSISHEGFFLLALFLHILCWIELEMISENVVQSSIFYQQLTRKKLHDSITLADFRRAFFFLAYIYIGFFGVGNLATLNSFDTAWVRCFLTNFSPFTMSALILLKVVVPFFVVSMALRVLTLKLNIQPSSIFLIVLVYCNIMGLNFLFLIRNEGSWLDIGTSLSHYVIQQATIVFLLILHSLSQVIIPLPVSYATAKFHSL